MHRACLLDALGTTVRLEPPWERIDRTAVAGLPAERVRSAFLVEMSFYAEHAHEAHDARSLAALRRRCAELLSRELDRRIGVATMMEAIAFAAYPDAAPALAGLRRRGLRLVCVSNWDYELPQVLVRAGLGTCFDGAVASATAGARKPDPAIFEAGLKLAGCTAAEALHVGDSDADVEAADAAGIEVLRIDRGGSDGGDISSLVEIEEHLRP